LTYLGFASEGSVGFRFGASQETITYEYKYDVREENFNGRYLKRLSSGADQAMRSCPQCGYYPDFKKFVDYYGNVDYTHKWINAAFYGEQTNFENGRGNADFGIMDKGALSEAIAKGSAYMSVLMYVIKQLEDSMSKCNAGCTTAGCNEGAVHSLDEAVAFYAGSLEGRDGSGDGVLLYNLADKRSLDFRTAGENGDSLEGTSYVNIQVIREFQRAQLFLLEKDCPSAEIAKTNIVNLMKVPLIQGVLRYAYVREFANPGTDELSVKAEAANPGTDELSMKAEAAGASFAAAVLPWVHACERVDADIIYDIMRVGSEPSQQDSFKEVKQAFERNYKCLGISCSDVGGQWAVDGYAPGAEPCGSGASGANGTVALSATAFVLQGTGSVEISCPDADDTCKPNGSFGGLSGTFNIGEGALTSKDGGVASTITEGCGINLGSDGSGGQATTITCTDGCTCKLTDGSDCDTLEEEGTPTSAPAGTSAAAVVSTAKIAVPLMVAPSDCNTLQGEGTPTSAPAGTSAAAVVSIAKIAIPLMVAVGVMI
jgi:hypothetical protein